MATTVRIEIDGSMREVTKPELFELAKQGLVQPETRLFWGNQSTTVGTIKGIEFGTPELPDENEAEESSSSTTSSWFNINYLTWLANPQRVGCILFCILFFGFILWLSPWTPQGWQALKVFGIGTFILVLGVVWWACNPNGCGIGCFAFTFLLFISLLCVVFENALMTDAEWQQSQQEQAQIEREKTQEAERQKKENEQRELEEKQKGEDSSGEGQTVRTYAEEMVRAYFTTQETFDEKSLQYSDVVFGEKPPKYSDLYSPSKRQWRISGTVYAPNASGETVLYGYIVEVKKVAGFWVTVSRDVHVY